MDSALELKRLRELALRAAHTGAAQYTRFMEPSMMNDARAAANIYLNRRSLRNIRCAL